jgi:hypothetical protein
MEDTEDKVEIEDKEEEQQGEPEKDGAKSFGDYVKDTIAATKDDEGKKPESDEEGEPEKKEASAKSKEKSPKTTAQERIRQLADEKKVLGEEKSKLEGELIAVRSEISEIRQLLATGKITKEEAQERKEEAQESLEDIVNKIELSENLLPYRAELFKLIGIVADTITRQRIEPLLTAEQARYEKRATQQEQKILTDISAVYTAEVETKPELFEFGEDGKVKVDKAGDPVIKAVYEQAMMELLNPYTQMRTINGQQIPYNPLATNPEGMKMIFNQVYSTLVLPAKKAMREKKQIENLKKSRVSTPSKTSPKTLSTFRDYFNEEAQTEE